MPALNFSAQFAGLVESGRKTQTIRRRRKTPINSGAPIYLYAGQRTKACRKLGEGRVTNVMSCYISDEGLWLHEHPQVGPAPAADALDHYLELGFAGALDEEGLRVVQIRMVTQPVEHPAEQLGSVQRTFVIDPEDLRSVVRRRLPGLVVTPDPHCLPGVARFAFREGDGMVRQRTEALGPVDGAQEAAQ